MKKLSRVDLIQLLEINGITEYSSKILDFIIELRNEDQDKWISVEDELPKKGLSVLILYEDGVINIGSYDYKDLKNHFAVFHDHLSSFEIQHDFDDKITHWQPLPNKPK